MRFSLLALTLALYAGASRATETVAAPSGSSNLTAHDRIGSVSVQGDYTQVGEQIQNFNRPGFRPRPRPVLPNNGQPAFQQDPEQFGARPSQPGFQPTSGRPNQPLRPRPQPDSEFPQNEQLDVPRNPGRFGPGPSPTGFQPSSGRPSPSRGGHIGQVNAHGVAHQIGGTIDNRYREDAPALKASSKEHLYLEQGVKDAINADNRIPEDQKEAIANLTVAKMTADLLHTNMTNGELINTVETAAAQQNKTTDRFYGYYYPYYSAYYPGFFSNCWYGYGYCRSLLYGAYAYYGGYPYYWGAYYRSEAPAPLPVVNGTISNSTAVLNVTNQELRLLEEGVKEAVATNAEIPAHEKDAVANATIKQMKKDLTSSNMTVAQLVERVDAQLPQNATAHNGTAPTDRHWGYGYGRWHNPGCYWGYGYCRRWYYGAYSNYYYPYNGYGRKSHWYRSDEAPVNGTHPVQNVNVTTTALKP